MEEGARRSEKASEKKKKRETELQRVKETDGWRKKERRRVAEWSFSRFKVRSAVKSGAN